MTVKLKNGVEIENVRFFKIEPDFALATLNAFAFVENENGEIGRKTIPYNEIPGISIKENGETRFDIFN